ncbi:nucleotide-diphospho-sugar transferase [Leptodontidium sp. 2 PMI_412]|nr:nucleotide-diphospho-sugar transferase [Leptodontidium sp. MPI-SDFR-AT-0119]KAH9221728.1 nucleotide-diphospho-sugar transferase [Leptodontidium sp. 2 PMI_412]
MLHLGQLTLTLDLIIKLLFTFAYTHGFTNILSRSRKPNQSQPKHPGEQPIIFEHADGPASYEKRLPDTPLCQNQRIIATVVGWREDKDLYRKCLESFANDQSCGPLIAGIDGDTAEDEDMVKIFLSMFPYGTVIRLEELLSRTLEQYMLSASLTDVEDEQTCAFIMEHISSFIRGLLEEKIPSRSIKDVQALCIVQPHQSKKEILFTTLCFAGVVARELSIPYLFSTDSDSAIVPGALKKIITSLEGNDNIGGVSGHLRFRNPRPTYLTRMTASWYWFEQEIPKIQGAIFGATECQPGPCAGFRVSVLKLVLVPWYCQRTCGHKTNINEDRHLTTRVLWAGFTVHYAPGAIVYTDAPETFDAWVRQQVRWSRGTMIETLWYPWMFNRLYPWHIYSIIKARVAPLVTFWSLTHYALGSQNGMPAFRSIFLVDIFCATALQVTYLVHMSPDQPTHLDILWLLPSLFWFTFMSPGIVIWSLLTIWDDSWGNVPRAISRGNVEQHKAINSLFSSDVFQRLSKMRAVGFQILWMGIVLIAGFRALFSLVI